MQIIIQVLIQKIIPCLLDWHNMTLALFKSWHAFHLLADYGNLVYNCLETVVVRMCVCWYVGTGGGIYQHPRCTFALFCVYREASAPLLICI